ncbi:2-oxoglutarate dehydrogenase, E2 component, dihydrolipoamide succinyltransferase [Corynebacterium pseudodiphtheriticum]|uniref:2-oxoglutarate dehydrogenase, E2 component, dihydrolipoamide succinyltransferase n=1 Tax=Corynebacterium pseudodiphtheriticum TaxID=37637 RepID=UPI002542C934|nr:2-oxoglutarate dehydrogenase, E2 component, dihydrolipoamide succinyltransferase [Corynebacterium pseudodiphtheriticum]MDK4206098.1 2-oxoglutarate dehydrogenase, E2 component, dihydrolipoamide succinyltransferase [Corynebacterium pseudodiphtheriticum]MDK4236441.1 2-oxoglutarate dehydrogenase, E2 component, dihydrolipoamide succinyltransferase [Corynebacterium pseudodiphtheriticum]MDK8395306.1 2-oxoglutarate dehydrogenase, E2 component, dihydrolipoamide succinyltransferase [Corynebacterium pse
MSHSVEMPELGESVTEGTITQWLKSVGDTVEADEPLLEVSTDKVDTEVPSPVSGTLLEIKAEEDDTVEVGDVIAIIGDEGESADSQDSTDAASTDDSDDADDAKDNAGSEDSASEEKEDNKESKNDKKSSGGSSQATDVEMPELGESVTEGTITQWLKSVGDTVEVDEPLLEVSTDKVDTEVPSPVAGTIIEILAEEDDTVEVGEVIVRVGDENAAADDSDDSDDAGDAEDNAGSEDSASEEKEDNKESKNDKKSSGGSSQATDVEMPELGESVTEGTITQWLKSVGDTVEVDEPLLEVSTDKVDTEVPSPVAGTIIEILAEEDDTVEVGEVIVRVGDENAAADDSNESDDSKDADKKSADKKSEDKEAGSAKNDSAKKDSADKKQDSDQETKKANEGAAKDSAKKNSGKVPYVTPLVRKLADKHGVDLSSLEGTGVGGRIRKQDVMAAVEGSSADSSAQDSAQSSEKDAKKAGSNWSTKSVDPEKAELRGTTQKVNRIRQITAEKMVEALQISAQLTHVQEIDMTAVSNLRKANKQAFADKHGSKLTFLPFFVKATVEALVSHPNVNASYNAEKKEMTYHADVNVAIAVDTPKGLLTPVIKKAQDKSLPEIAAEIIDLADRARNNKLKPNDLTGATFTVTNIGSEGALLDTPILVPPQAGILGTAVIEKRPVVVTEDGQDAIAIRQMCYLPFTYDHQVVDGADAGRFITTIKDRLETADFEADLDL